MDKINFEYHPTFFTATILNWQNLLEENSYKDIIIKSLQFLKNEGSIVVYGYVIMPNHIHLLWQIQDGFKYDRVQMRFMKFTAQQMKFRLLDTNNLSLNNFKVSAKDREYQFWERNPLSVELWSPAITLQKLEYIHRNPLQEKWQLADCPESYKYSSANFYKTGVDDFGLLTHYQGD